MHSSSSVNVQHSRDNLEIRKKKSLGLVRNLYLGVDIKQINCDVNRRLKRLQL